MIEVFLSRKERLLHTFYYEKSTYLFQGFQIYSGYKQQASQQNS